MAHSDAPAPDVPTDRPDRSIRHQQDGDAARPSDTLDRGTQTREREPRKSSLLRNA